MKFKDLEIIDKKRNSNYIRLSIKPELDSGFKITSKITLTYSNKFKKTQIDSMLESKYIWLKQKSNEIENLNNFLDSNNVVIFGKTYKRNEVNLNKSKTAMKQKLTDLLLAYIQNRAMFFKKNMGVEYKSIEVKTLKSKAGYCTNDARLCFALFLLCADTSIIDYVIIHELSHIKHFNHSAKFWNLVKNECPNFKILRKELKTNSIIYRANLNLLLGES